MEVNLHRHELQIIEEMTPANKNPLGPGGRNGIAVSVFLRQTRSSPMQSVEIVLGKASMDGPVAEPSFSPGNAGHEKRPKGVPAFKEWAIVCASIERGETSVIFRKGGIAEGSHGFQFKHSRFFLFPTYFHEQIEQTRLSRERDVSAGNGGVTISLFVEIEFATLLRDLNEIQALEHLHVLQSTVLEERFHYEQEGLHVAFLRAFRISPVWELPFNRSYGGCRSWITLPDPPAGLRKESVLAGEEQERRRALCLGIFGSHVKQLNPLQSRGDSVADPIDLP